MTKTILAVDDSQTLRRALELTFQNTDFDLVAVDRAEEALAQFDTTNPALVLVDAGLPDGAGYRLAADIRARGDGIPIVLLTSHFSAFDAARASSSGVSAHIDKPFDTQGLIDLAEAQLDAPPAPPPEASIEVSMPVVSASVEVEALPSADLDEIEDIDIEDVPDEAMVPLDDEQVEIAVEPAEVPTPTSDPWAVAAPPPPEPSAEPELPARALKTAASSLSSEAISAEPRLDGLPREELRALAREVLERIAWEVVPDLAETIIKEELTRLTQD